MTELAFLGIDVEVERKGILATFAELITAKRELRPVLVFFKGKDRMLAVTARPYGDEADFNAAMHDMLFLFPALRATSCFIGMSNEILTKSGDMKPAIVTIALHKSGALSEGHVYEVDDDGHVFWAEGTELATNAPLFSDFVDHMMPIFSTITNFPFDATEVVDYLNDEGYDIEYHGTSEYLNLNMV